MSVTDMLQMKGASNSLRKSVREIEAHLSGGSINTPGLERAELHAALAEFAMRWYRRGFNRGHRVSYDAYKERGKVPKSLELDVKKELFGAKSKKVKLRSRIKN